MSDLRERVEALRDDLRKLQRIDAIHVAAQEAYRKTADSLDDALLSAPCEEEPGHGQCNEEPGGVGEWPGPESETLREVNARRGYGHT